ncbi:type II secretion system protein GspK [Rubellicoccus peritrichatus]|uniref:Type II secretion system protein GspK n=1 Tax=Rubellicoccus peritrichatus TaxID=3080537 RepID=A0AAQ3LGW4_9BACT|nr:type II secretion system protein GspK [Puniceicoccus sp. CR14]WOO41929.1 type II secretion system protein GspK [Puniceicoccus sp. CR14]
MSLFTNIAFNAHARRPRRGVVLVVVLGMLVLMAWLTTEIIGRVQGEMQLRGLREEASELRPAAYQTLELTIAVLAEIKELDGGLYSKVQGWDRPLEYLGLATPESSPEAEAFQSLADSEKKLNVTLSEEMAELGLPSGIEIDVVIEDESGRIAINKAREERLKLLFEAMEFEMTEAEILAQSFLDWIDPDNDPRINGAEAEYYQQKEPPFRPANRPLESLRELRLVHGFENLFFDETGRPNEHYFAFEKAVTLHGEGGINLNAANELSLAVLEEEIDLPPDEIKDYLYGADMVAGTADDRVFRPDLEADNLPTTGEGEPLDLNQQLRFVRVKITTSAGNSRFLLSTLLDLETAHRGGVYPFAIVELVENNPLL